MPTARQAAGMKTAIDLAGQLGCTLVAMCSKWSKPEEVARLARGAGIKLATIETDRLPDGLLPKFETTALLAGTIFERRTDTSLKRNLGLLVARLVNWNRIVFLDDDIFISDPDDLRAAVGLLDTHATVGMWIDGMPDNSVVCHAYRGVGGPQDTFIGGGALAVGSAAMTSFFPNIYNEDWFFLLDDVRMRPTAITGYAKQGPYDPFANDQRARSEEFGDLLAEGVYWLLDHGRRVQDANAAFWKYYLGIRRQFIADVIDRAQRLDKSPKEKSRMIAALKAASGRCQRIDPELCVEYLRAWRTDRTRWRRHLDGLDEKAAMAMLKQARLTVIDERPDA
ncbi:MAG TPA: hypothetical protein VGX25_23175 [Actinophytocola sp.]|uniref:hypothetical protein n=1 Tax=Actinophytocola sp. TaxID=1872138 RepID=UPI002DDCAC49|nr:hypothetical protein [Actinophytocola sp.]HEV2782304.1 hypothetical protein [Actinophytocola sp.]